MSKERLTKKYLLSNSIPSEIEMGDVHANYPERVLQFGEGNFLRAFVTWMFDKMNENGYFKGKIVAVQPIRQGLVPKFEEQDCLYTLLLRGIENGVATEKRRIITTINRALNPYTQWDAMLECARNPEMRFIVSNTTEAGIAYLQEKYQQGVCPESYPAKVCSYLYERYKFFHGATDKGIVIICCELIEDNATHLKEIIHRLIQEWGFEKDFADWVDSSCVFMNSLVDRIVPGYPRAEVERITEELGYEDQLLDTGEAFHLWVIEGPKSVAEELPFTKLGLNVVWTENMSSYRTRKVRILNGAHTSSVLAAYLSGIDTVGDMMKDELFSKYVKQILTEEICQTVPGVLEETIAFANATLDRFRNPYIRHELLSIALNSISKWKVRVLPTLRDVVYKQNKMPKLLSFSLAALLAFYRGEKNSNGEYQGMRSGNVYPIRDGAPELEFITNAWKEFASDGNMTAMIQKILSAKSLWDEDLTCIPDFADAVANHLNNILKNGVRATVQELLN